MKTIFKVCVLMLLITFSSCNEDLYESQTQQNEGKFQIRELSKSEIELNPKLSQELNQIQNFKSKIVASKIVYDPVYDFFVNTDEALFISDGVSESYTFPVYRATSNTVVENLVIHIQNEQTLVYLVDYGYSLSQLQTMTKAQLEQNDVKHYLINLNADSILNGKLDVPRQEHVCSETYVSNPLYGNCTETHSNGQTCNQQEFILQSTSCQWITTGGGGGTTGSSTTGGTTGSGPTGGSTNTGSNVYDSVTINTTFVGCSTCPEFTLGLSNFLGTLDADQLAIWNDLDDRTKENIVNYLDRIDADPIFVKELMDLASNEDDKELIPNLINISIVTKQNGYFDNPFDSNYYNLINPYSVVDTQTHSPIWSVYFTAQCAFARYKLSQEPGWNDLHPWVQNAKVYWEASKEMFHLGLDLIGLVPIVGEIADLTNGVIYTIEGDGVNATLSYASTIPIAGWFSAGVKFAKRADGLVYTVKAANNLIDFGKYNSKKFRAALGLAPGDPRQAHHLIPREFVDNALVQKAAKSTTNQGFHMHSALNGIPMPTTNHLTGHNLYSQKVLQRLNYLNSISPTPEIAYQQINNYINDIKIIIQNNPSMNLGQISNLID